MPTNNAANAQNAQYNLLVGTGSAYTNIAPSATSGVPLISQGAASNPAYGTAVVAGGGTGVVSNTAYAVLCGGTTGTGAIQSVASVGSSGQVLTSNGAGALPTFQGPAVGQVVQYVQTNKTALQRITTQLPYDDTIPQNTEGAEVFTLSITPKSSSNILVINSTIFYGIYDGVTNYLPTVALFQDTTANALTASAGPSSVSPANGMVGTCTLSYKMTAGTTSATTFKIRVGTSNPGKPVDINGFNNARVFGGVASTTLEIWEIQA